MTGLTALRTAADAMRADTDDRWHPVAHWIATHYRELADAGGDVRQVDSPGDTAHAVTIARAYLGGGAA